MKCSAGYLFKTILFLVISAGLISCGGADDRKEVYIEKAKKHIQNKNFNKARVEIKNALQIDPKYSDGYFFLGEIKYSQKDLSSAISNYKKAIELDINNHNAKIALAKSYSVTNYEEYLKDAENMLEEVEKAGVFNEKAGVVRATILIKRHKNIEAEKILKNIITKNESFVNAYSTLGYLYISENKNDKAIDLFKSGVNKNPDNIEFLMSLSDVLIKQEKYDEAEIYLKKVITLRPDVYSYKVALATLNVTRGELDRAESLLRSALENGHDDVKANVTLITFLAQKRSIKEAINELTDIIDKHDDDSGYKILLSDYYVTIGMYDKALELLDQVENKEKLGPLFLKAKTSKAEIFYRKNDLVNSESVLNEILQENRNDFKALLLKSRIDIKNQKFTDAINSLRLVVKEKPAHKEAPMLLIETLKRQGDMELALTTIDQVIDAAPGNYQAYIDFSTFLVKNNKINKAFQLINNAADLFKDNFPVLKQKFKLLVGLNKKEEVVQLLEYMKSVMPSQYKVYQLGGIYYTKVGEFDLAIKNLKQALINTNDYYFIYRDLSRAYLLNKKIDELYAFLKSELKLEARKVAALQSLGDLYFTDKKFQKSRESYQQALSIQNDWIYAYEGMIKLSVADKDYDQAIQWFKKTIEISDNKLSIQIELLKFYHSLSKFSEVDKLYKELIAEYPSNMMLVNNYISFILENMNDAEHIKQADMLIDKLKNNPNSSVKDTVAWFYVNKKQYEKAVLIYADIINDTDSAHLNYHYGYALFFSGDKKKAKQYLEAAFKSKTAFKGKDGIQKLLNQI